MRDLSRGGGRSLTDKLAALLDRQLDKDHYDLVYVLLHHRAGIGLEVLATR